MSSIRFPMHFSGWRERDDGRCHWQCRSCKRRPCRSTVAGRAATSPAGRRRWRCPSAALLRQARRRFPFVERIVAHRQLDARDREAQRCSRVCRPAQAPDRGTHPRLDQPQPAPLARLLATDPHRRHFRETRGNPHLLRRTVVTWFVGKCLLDER